MNIELIKKYKTEFDHWLNGGEVLFYTWKWYNSKDNPSSTFNHNAPSDIEYYVINDEFVEFRKALAEGKTVQYNFGNHGINKKDFPNKWKDLDPSIGILADRACIEDYRIKPEEPKFKVGDFVRYIHSNSKQALKIENINCGFYYFDDTGMLLRIDEMIKWNPNPKELCWFTNDTTELRAVLGQFDCMTHDNFYKATNGSSYSNCEPFLNSKPSWFQ